jgi:tRNA(Ile)-lysidine synthase
MTTLLSQLAATISRHQMIQPGDRVAVACSGGPDSTALVLLMHELRNELGLSLSVCHLNHQLRGNESDEDERFVRKLATRLQVPGIFSRSEVRTAAAAGGMNLEAKAREVRYAFFRSLVGQCHADRVAVGHTANDQAETVLHRLIRGTGTTGLAGIYPVVDHRIIRPLIECQRAEIVNWLQSRNEVWREDASNGDIRLTRNRIRHKILPLLSEVNPKVVERMTDIAHIARDEEAFWKSHLQPILANCVQVEAGCVRMEISHVREMPLAVVRRVLRSVLQIVIANARENGRPGVSFAADFNHIERLSALVFERSSGGCVSLPGGLEAYREYLHLIFGRVQATKRDRPGFLYRVAMPGWVDVPEIGAGFRFELVQLNRSDARYNGSANALLDPKLSGAELTLRSWQPGDAYTPLGHWTQRKLKDLFQRKRIPPEQRRQWPLLIAGEKIVWAKGWGASREFSPSAHSQEAILLHESSLEE